MTLSCTIDFPTGIHTDGKYNVYKHILVYTGGDYEQVLAAAKAYAKETDCYINPVVEWRAVEARQKIYPGITNESNPDLRTTKYGYIDVKSPHNKNNIVHNANKACKQGGIAVITDLVINKKITAKTISLTTEAIFKDNNVDNKGNPNYTKDQVHWLVNGRLLKCNKPKQK